MTKALVSAMVIGLTAVSGAHAQTVIVNNGGNPIVPRITRDARKVTITMNVQLTQPVATLGSTEEFTTALNAATSSLEDVIQQQCGVLSKTFKGECRVVQLTLAGNAGNRNNLPMANDRPQTVTETANMTFEIDVPPQPTPDPTSKP